MTTCSTLCDWLDSELATALPMTLLVLAGLPLPSHSSLSSPFAAAPPLLAPIATFFFKSDFYSAIDMSQAAVPGVQDFTW
jgi:hypothetical protein